MTHVCAQKSSEGRTPKKSDDAPPARRNVSTRNAVLSDIFGPSDGVMSTALVRETDLSTRREKHKFFRDVEFRRQNDDVNLRQRIKGQLIGPLYDLAAAAIDNLPFDADTTEVNLHRWSGAMTASEAWWHTLRSTAPFCILARILEAKNEVSDADASTIHRIAQ
jgi:hypothetical protein